MSQTTPLKKMSGSRSRVVVVVVVDGMMSKIGFSIMLSIWVIGRRIKGWFQPVGHFSPLFFLFTHPTATCVVGTY
jgi:hypothetical protein